MTGGEDFRLTNFPLVRKKLHGAFIMVTKSRKRQLISMVFASVMVMNFFVIFNPTEVKSVMIDLTAVLTSGAALFISGTATLLAYLGKRQRESYTWLSTGLTLWFSAEVIWVYNRQVIGIEVPYPSIADGAWIIGYGFFAIYIYRIIGMVGKTHLIEKNMVLLVSVAVSMSLVYILNLTFGVAEILNSGQDIVSTAVSFAYPVLDGILLVPSMVILSSLRKGDPSSNQWTMMSLSFVLLTIGDIGFGYSFAIAPSVAEEYEWIWSVFYNTGYISIVASVLWAGLLIKNQPATSTKTEDSFNLK